MKKLSPIKLIWFTGFFVVTIFLIAIIFLNQIKSEIFTLITSYGYPAVFLVTLIVETLAQPIGPEVSLLAGKILELNMVSVILVTTIGSILATFLNYEIGRLFYEKVCSDESCKKYYSLFQKYGRYGLLISAIGPVPYVPFCWFSGAFGLSVKKLFYFGIFPRIIRIIVVSQIIYLIL